MKQFHDGINYHLICFRSVICRQLYRIIAAMIKTKEQSAAVKKGNFVVDIRKVRLLFQFYVIIPYSTVNENIYFTDRTWCVVLNTVIPYLIYHSIPNS